MTRTYSVSGSGIIRRLDNLTGAWVNLNLAPSIPGGGKIVMLDVETDTNNSDKVFAVGTGAVSGNNFGIYVSVDAGVTWFMPGGDYVTNIDVTNKLLWYEVSVVDSNNIFVSGQNGYVAKSTDGGLTFNLTTQLPALPTFTGGPLEISDVYSIHFISPAVGVIGLLQHTAYTNNGGITWSILNTGNPLTIFPDPEYVSGIHISSDQQTIVALSNRNIFLSTNAGTTFVSQYVFNTKNGIHLTWTDDLNLWAFGDKAERVRSTDGGLTWTVINPFNLAGSIQYAGHFYSNTNGFFSAGSSLFRTSDSGMTGSISDTVAFNINAVWTRLEPPVCYRLKNCLDGVADIIISDDLSLYLGQVVTLQNLPSGSLIPGCWNVLLNEDCTGAVLPNTIGIVDSFVDCTACLPVCYELTDCASINPPIITSTDLSAYVGEVIRLESCPDDCWSVAVSGTCVGSVPIGTILNSFIDCVACNPPPVVPPIELNLRSIKPGYSTDGCPPAYTEKVNCTFSEIMYDQVVTLRYGIQVCCDNDPDKWIIKKNLLDLNALYNAELCKNTLEECCPPCNVQVEIVTYPTMGCPTPTAIVPQIII